MAEFKKSSSNFPFFEIAGRKIGYDYEPLVIAEIGINHEGSLEVAKQMVDAAKEAGVEMVKHQTHIVEDEMSSAAKNTIPGNADVSIYEIMRRCSLNEAEELELKQYVEALGLYSSAHLLAGQLQTACISGMYRHTRSVQGSVIIILYSITLPHLASQSF